MTPRQFDAWVLSAERVDRAALVSRLLTDSTKLGLAVHLDPLPASLVLADLLRFSDLHAVVADLVAATVLFGARQQLRDLPRPALPGRLSRDALLDDLRALLLKGDRFGLLDFSRPADRRRFKLILQGRRSSIVPCFDPEPARRHFPSALYPSPNARLLVHHFLDALPQLLPLRAGHSLLDVPKGAL
jgi:hypothetical protein